MQTDVENMAHDDGRSGDLGKERHSSLHRGGTEYGVQRGATTLYGAIYLWAQAFVCLVWKTLVAERKIATLLTLIGSSC